LLLTHARYKNFIDENNDSLIRTAADYFIDERNAEEASMALFLMGKIQMNAGRLGEAAVSFSKGLDIARESHIYMWEGQCARGLVLLYGNLLDSSAQLKYAKEAYEAFSKGGYEDWMDWSRLEIAIANNNYGQYDESASIARELLYKSRQLSDTLMMEESSKLMGMSLYGMGEYGESIRTYAHAYSLNPHALTGNDLKLISTAIAQVNPDSLPEDAEDFIGEVSSMKGYRPSFVVLAEQSKYREAYQELNDYKNRQDSVFAVILHSNVSESVRQYEDAEEKLERERRKTECILTFAVILVTVMIAVITYMSFRSRLHRREREMEKLEADIESIRKDMLLQLQVERERNNDEEASPKCSKSFMQFIRETYSEANTLCDKYYQKSDSAIAKGDLTKEAQRIIHDFTNAESLKEIETYVDSVSDNLYSSFKKEMYDVSDDNRRLFLYLLVGFSNRSISVLLDQTPGAVYTKKSRLKKYILESNATRREEYLNAFK